ncbi:MAG: hypothetical protein EOM68_18845, partial [Spirochaetia bacterium]|nr:hypothetical protein [Spirochaetia bacterium]
MMLIQEVKAHSSSIHNWAGMKSQQQAAILHGVMKHYGFSVGRVLTKLKAIQTELIPEVISKPPALKWNAAAMRALMSALEEAAVKHKDAWLNMDIPSKAEAVTPTICSLTKRPFSPSLIAEKLTSMHLQDYGMQAVVASIAGPALPAAQQLLDEIAEAAEPPCKEPKKTIYTLAEAKELFNHERSQGPTELCSCCHEFRYASALKPLNENTLATLPNCLTTTFLPTTKGQTMDLRKNIIHAANNAPWLAGVPPGNPEFKVQREVGASDSYMDDTGIDRECPVSDDEHSCNGWEFCSSCTQYLKKLRIPVRSAYNQVGLHPLPPGVKPLNEIVERAVSLSLPSALIRALRKGGQKSIHGGIVNIATDLSHINDMLPRHTNPQHTIELTIKVKNSYKSFLCRQNVSPAYIHSTLKWLSRKPLYRDHIHRIKTSILSEPGAITAEEEAELRECCANLEA